MKISSVTFIVAILAPFTGAVDIINHTDANCGGSSITYRNIGPNSCAPGLFTIGGRPRGTRATRIIGLPGNGRLNLWNADRSRGTCGAFKSSLVRFGNNFCGNSATEYAGSSWGVAAAKRQVRRSEAEECTSTATPDILTLAEGQEYELGGLAPEKVEELVALVIDGTKAEDLPDEFAQLQSN